MEDPSHYVLLASAIAGRRVSVCFAKRGARLAFSDGQAIYLPNQPGNSHRRLRHEVIVQALLLGAGSLAGDTLRHLLGRAGAARRYTYLEVLRGAQLLQDRLPTSFL